MPDDVHCPPIIYAPIDAEPLLQNPLWGFKGFLYMISASPSRAILIAIAPKCTPSLSSIAYLRSDNM